jgi:hypothetical protein
LKKLLYRQWPDEEALQHGVRRLLVRIARLAPEVDEDLEPYSPPAEPAVAEAAAGDGNESYEAEYVPPPAADSYGTEQAPALSVVAGEDAAPTQDFEYYQAADNLSNRRKPGRSRACPWRMFRTRRKGPGIVLP